MPGSLEIQKQAELVRRLKSDSNTPENLSEHVKKLKNLKKNFSKFEADLLAENLGLVSNGKSKNNSNSKSLKNLLESQFFFSDAFSNYEYTKGLIDYGPAGLKLRKNIENEIRNFFINNSEIPAFEIESTILTPELVLENSGHKVRFNDLVVKDLNNGEILRVDHLFEKKGKGELFSKEKDKIEATFKILEELYPKRFPSFSKPFELGLMYKTNGSLDESSSSNSSGNYYFLRPETAQGSYLAFKKVLAYNQNKFTFMCGAIW